MLKSQELLIRMSELRQRANDPATSEADALAARADLTNAEAEYRAALTAEAKELEGLPVSRGALDTLTAEQRELVNGVDARRIMAAAVMGHATQGREAELQQEMRVEGNVIPWAVLEARAVATGLTAGGVDSAPAGFINRAFAGSIMDFAGVMVAQVAAGTRSYPYLGTGIGTPGRQTDSTNVAESTGAFTANELTPRSMFRGSLRINRGDLIAFPGADVAMTNELRLATMDGMMKDIIDRTSAGLMAFGADPTRAAQTTAAQYLSEAYAAIDGIHANSLADVRMLLHKATVAHMGATVIATGADRNVYEYLTAQGATIRATPHAPTQTNTEDGVIIAAAQSPNTVAALFGGGLFVVNDTTNVGTTGDVVIGGQLHGDFAIARSDAYTRKRYRDS